jgi:hypothetical protein
MAVLSVGDLSLEIAYRDFRHGWVHYDIWFRWRGEPVINDVVLRRGVGWSERAPGVVWAHEHLCCYLLPTLREVLERNVPGYWEPMDPDVLLAVYPGEGFPFVPVDWRLVDFDPEAREARQARKAEREALGPLPGDFIDLLLFVDTYNFSPPRKGYSGNGICLKMVPTRQQLREFYEELRREYVVFRDCHDIENVNRKELGDQYREEWF